MPRPAAPAATPAAAPAAAPAATQAEEQTPPIQFPFDAATTQCVPDLRALSRLPADSAEDGVHTFRAMLLPIGKTLHVPNEPGCYATRGPWRMQTALCKVYFLEATQREPELLLSFVDYGMVSNSRANGIFVETLSLPLQKARNLYEETPKFTSIKDVCGFSHIQHKDQPWCAMLRPALERQPMFERLEIFTPIDIVTMLKTPLQTRLLKLQAFAEEDVAKMVADLERQDKRAAQKQKASLESRLAATCEFFSSLPPKKYDRTTKDRVIEISEQQDTAVQWLTTPLRESLSSGTAHLASTVRREMQFDAPPPAASAPCAAAAADAHEEEEESDHFAELEPEVEEVERDPSPSLKSSARSRAKTKRFSDEVAAESKVDRKKAKKSSKVRAALCSACCRAHESL